MSRQHASPVLVPSTGPAIPLVPLGLGQDGHGWTEADVQALVQAHPACLPIAEIDPLFADPVPICTELNTTAGAIDNLLVTASGLPVLVECKLWRNPQARREVVGQILDYAKELSRWSSSDLQREARRRLGCEGDPVLELVRAAGHDVEEIAFNDALTLNLRRGRFLLLIVGDGIREGVEAIAEYLQAHAGLHFTLGLVELPIYAMPDGGRLVAPRVVARTHLVTRTVIAAPEGMAVLDDAGEPATEADVAADDLTQDRIRFWTDFIDGLAFDDPDQPRPKVSKQGYVYISMPVPGGSCWITAWRNIRDRKVGIFLSYTRGSPGDRAVRRVVEDWPAIRDQLGGSAQCEEDSIGRPLIADEYVALSLSEAGPRAEALTWLRARANDFVSVLRPRVREAAEATKNS